MRILYIFRGENLRNKRGRQSALDCLKNWNETLFLSNIEFDIALVTFPSEILDDLKLKLNPKYLIITENVSQEYTMTKVINMMKEKKDIEYDRYVILRFDFLYKIKIDRWSNWDSNGIILVNRDVHWPKLKYYADIVFIVDKDYIDLFEEAFNNHPRYALHHIGGNLEYKQNVFLMYEGYYYMHDHPLHALLNLSPYPDLENYNPGTRLYDISPWN